MATIKGLAPYILDPTPGENNNQVTYAEKLQSILLCKLPQDNQNPM